MDGVRKRWLSHLMHMATQIEYANGIPSWIDVKADPRKPFVLPEGAADGIDARLAAPTITCGVYCRLCRDDSSASGRELEPSIVTAVLHVKQGAPVTVVESGQGSQVCLMHAVRFGFDVGSTVLRAESSKVSAEMAATAKKEKKEERRKEKEKKKEEKPLNKEEKLRLFHTMKDADDLSAIMTRKALPPDEARALLAQAQVEHPGVVSKLSPAARAGDRVAQACCLQRGYLLPDKRPLLAMAILNQLHEAGDVAATFFIGCAKGLGRVREVHGDVDGGIAMVKDAVDRGFTAGLGVLARMLTLQSPHRDLALAAKLTKQALENGCTLSMYRIGRELVHGDGVPQDIARGTALLEASGHPGALTLLAMLKTHPHKLPAKRGRPKSNKPEAAKKPALQPPPQVWTDEAMVKLRAEQAAEIAGLNEELRKGTADVLDLARQWSEEKKRMEEQREIMETQLALRTSEIRSLRDQLSTLTKFVGEK